MSGYRVGMGTNPTTPNLPDDNDLPGDLTWDQIQYYFRGNIVPGSSSHVPHGALAAFLQKNADTLKLDVWEVRPLRIRGSFPHGAPFELMLPDSVKEVLPGVSETKPSLDNNDLPGNLTWDRVTFHFDGDVFPGTDFRVPHTELGLWLYREFSNMRNGSFVPTHVQGVLEANGCLRFSFLETEAWVMDRGSNTGHLRGPVPAKAPEPADGPSRSLSESRAKVRNQESEIRNLEAEAACYRLRIETQADTIKRLGCELREALVPGPVKTESRTARDKLEDLLGRVDVVIAGHSYNPIRWGAEGGWLLVGPKGVPDIEFDCRPLPNERCGILWEGPKPELAEAGEPEPAPSPIQPLLKALSDDREYLRGWHSNIAVCVQDTFGDGCWHLSQAVARRFLGVLFSGHPGKPEMVSNEEVKNGLAPPTTPKKLEGELREGLVKVPESRGPGCVWVKGLQEHMRVSWDCCRCGSTVRLMGLDSLPQPRRCTGFRSLLVPHNPCSDSAKVCFPCQLEGPVQKGCA